MVCPHHELTIAHTEKNIYTHKSYNKCNPGINAVYKCAKREIVTSN